VAKASKNCNARATEFTLQWNGATWLSSATMSRILARFSSAARAAGPPILSNSGINLCDVL
jgi:hypothetical protein